MFSRCSTVYLITVTVISHRVALFGVVTRYLDMFIFQEGQFGPTLRMFALSNTTTTKLKIKTRFLSRGGITERHIQILQELDVAHIPCGTYYLPTYSKCIVL